MPKNAFDFSDWFSDKREYHRMFVPDNPMMEHMALYSFNSGTLYETLLSEKMICVSGDEAVFSGGTVGSPSFYDEAFALKTFDKIMFEQPAKDAIVNTYLVETTLEKVLDTDYTNIVHDDDGVGGAINMFNDFVLLPSGSGYTPTTFNADGSVLKSGEYFEDSANWNTRDEFVTDVQTSVNNSGLHWTVPLCFQLGQSGVDGMDCIKCANVKFHLHLLDVENGYSERRTTALKGVGTSGPMIVAAPSTAYGKAGHTTAVPGKYADIEHGGVDNPRNVVAAPIDLHYNQNTGQFESGTKSMVVILLSDMEGVTPGSVDVKLVHSTSTSAMITDGDSDVYLGAHELGRAMPIGVKGSNPNHYGPDDEETGCKPSEKKSIIVVVNRTATSYENGERVLVQYIDGEWLITQSMQGEADVDAAGTSFAVGKWGPIFHGMAPAMHFMRNVTVRSADHRYQANNQYLPVAAEEYQSCFRQTFYYDLLDHTGGYGGANSNWVTDDFAMYWTQKVNGSGVHVFRPSPYHYQFTSFDMMSDDLGGKNNYNLIANTNPLRFSTGAEPSDFESDTDDMYPFAGMSFPDGYVRGKMLAKQSLSGTGKLNLKVGGGAYANHYLTEKEGAIPFDPKTVVDRLDDDGNVILPGGGKNANLRGSMFQVKDSNLNVPADIALNASPNGEHGSPIESLAFLKNCLNFGSDWHYGWVKKPEPNPEGHSMQVDIQHDFYSKKWHGDRVNLVGGVKTYMNGDDRYAWVTTDDDPIPDNSMYDWAPAKKTHVAFIPLTAELYTHYDWPNPIYFHAGAGKMLGYPFPFSIPGLPAYNGFNPIPHPTFDILGSTFFNRETGPVPFSFPTVTTSAEITAEVDGGSGPFTYEVLPYLSMAGVTDDILRSYDNNGYMPDGWSQSTVQHGYEGMWSWNDTGGYYQEASFIVGEGAPPQHGACAVGFTTAKLNIKTSAQGMQFTVKMKDIGMDYKDSISSDAKTSRWGRRSDDKSDINTTALWVTVADAHPPEQTIYDPRYHAIMHFNPGTVMSPVGTMIWMSGNKTMMANDEPIVQTLSHPVLGSNSDPDLPEPKNYYYKTGYYGVEVLETDVDFRVPTWKTTATGENFRGVKSYEIHGTHVSRGTRVDKDSPIRDPEHWRVDPIRRGMLLPFNWFQRTIGIETNLVDGLAVPTVKIVGGGTGYKVGEVMEGKGGSGGGSYLSVKEVGSSGDILSLVVVYWSEVGGDSYRHTQYQYGFGYSHEDFGNSGVRYVNYIGGESSISPSLIAKGKDAEIYAVSGMVYDKFTSDSGGYINRPQQISAASEQGLREVRHGRMDTVKVTEMPIELPNANRDYDIYFHFHNDISYTVLGEPSTAPDNMQYMTVDFGPTTF
tara:strand:+ start:3204 stop:7292 length:4089 start_codon:yes stop_codon:yes gene_type:complete